MKNKDYILQKTPELVHEFLSIIGCKDEEVLKNTPLRVAKFWAEFLDYDFPEKLFENSIEYDHMVLVKEIKEVSFCKHHILPIFLEVKVGYIPKNYLIGASKLVRLVRQKCRNIISQEDLTHDILRSLISLTKSEDAGVEIKGKHTCLMIKHQFEGCMKTVALNGKFRSSDLKFEFLEER